MTDQKYVTFKAEEFDHWWGHQVRPRLEGVIDQPPQALDDAVVVRTQDIFAGPGLSAYAMCIQTALDLNAVTATPDGPPMFPVEVAHRLAVIRDYFYERAQEAFGKAEVEQAKVPD